MDSYQNFVETFKQAIASRDYESLKYVLKNIQQSLILIAKEHLQTFFSNIFDIRDGLLFFLELELTTKSTADRHIDEALIGSFNFLDFLIGNFHEETSFKNYINNIKEICELALRVKCSYYIQKAACNAFMNLIEKFSNNDLELNETLIQFVKEFHLNDEKVRKFIFCILGKIIKHNESPHYISSTYIINIYKKLSEDSLSEYNSDNNFHQNFHMYFDALSDIWDCEPPHDMKEKLNHIEEKLSQNMYQWIKNISYSQRNQKIRIVMKSGIEFLNRHMHRFQNFLYNDYKYWYNVFRNLSCEISTYKHCGQSALKKLYRIIGKILREENREENNEILEFFRGEFLKEFENSELNLTMLRLTIDGFSQMTASYKIYLSHDSKKMYSSISNCAFPLCSSEQCDPECIENICCYLEALAEILQYISNVTIGEVNILMKLSIYIIKKFPELTISKNALVISALLKTIRNLGYVDENLLQRYLDNIIYNGIAWSCSHTLALDAELQQELENLKQPPICYKNYLPLWTQLLNVTLYHDCEKLTKRVENTLLNMYVKLINRLNIRVKRQENTVFSDMALAQSAENQADFRVFTNLVDLYVDMIDKSNLFFSVHTIHVFLREIVKLSYKYPLLCGFYKIIRVTLKIFVRITKQQEDEEKKRNDLQMKELLSSYLVHILDLIPTFSNELLIACLYLILDVPGIEYVATAVPSAHMIPIFKIAFTIGLSDLEFAHTALTALEIWSDYKELRKWVGRTNELLCEIMPYLESYLRSAESTVEVSQDLIRKTMSMVKQVNLIDTKCMLRNLQRQILLFLGSLGFDALSNFVYQRSLNTGASWDRKNLLGYTFLLPDMRLSIHFDRMLPRIIALACSSSDRRTRIAACEVLHSIISLVIGTAMHWISSDQENPLYAILCPALLTLGCDSDEVVCNLFRPLMLQLMRWFSSTTHMSLSSAKSCALNSLFDGLSDDTNSPLREFAGMCLAEFVLWTINKQMSNEHEIQSNVLQLIRRIKHLALHPSTRKRVAAAIAFNHLYAILSEDDDIVSIYWFEMLHCFVRSMDGCDDPSIVNALDHIEKVIRYKSDILNMNVRDRKKPPEFDGTTLNHALYWLLSQCGVLDRHCRAKCMELYVNMSQYATGGSAQETTRTFVETYGIDRLNNIILKHLDSTLAFTSIDNLTTLLKALDYYIWLMKEKLLPLETLFPVRHDAREYIIFTCIKNFANQSWVLVPEKHVTTSMMTIKEFEQLQTLRCKTVMAVLNFVQMLLDIDNVLSESLWVESLFALTIKCVMHPQKIGFDIKNIEMTDKLPQILETLLNTMKLRLSDTLMDNFKQYLFKSLEGHISQLYNLDDIAQNDFCKELIQYVKGLIILKRYGILNLSKIVSFAHHATAIEQIFNFLVSKRLEKFTCKDLSAHMIEYLQVLMELQILQHETLITKTLLKLISISTPLIEDITHGKYFLNTFQDVIFEYILTNVDAITLLFDELLHNNNNLAFLLELIENLLLYLQQHKLKMQIHVDNIMDVILRRFECLMDAANNVDDTCERLINIYGIAVHLVSKPMEIESTYKELYKWILKQFTNSYDIEHKTKILQNFFVCLIDTTGRIEIKPEIEAILYTLKADTETLRPQLSVKMNTMKVINCFETLLRLLSTSRSVVILRCVINFAVTTDDCLFDKLQDYLCQYYCREKFDIEHASLSLDTTYRLFMDIRNMKQRLDILNVFLLPAFDFCNSTVIERFFERNICKLYGIIQCAVEDNANCKRIIVSQIGCYKLIAIMLARVETNKIVDANGTIVRNAGLSRIETGRELLQNLFRNGANVRMLNINQPDCQEIVRLLHCFAYNCTLAIVNLKEEELFYCSAFAENDLEKRYIWKNIVDCNRHYKIGQTFDEYPKTYETTVNIRSFSVVDKDKELASQRVHKYSYIHSYDLSTSTLNEDINAYDFNKSVLPKSAVASNSEPIMSITLEKDYFNNHECMPYICSVLNRVNSLRRKDTSMSAESKMPPWLDFFVKGMQKNAYDPNITLFILKIITNTADTVFKPYAKFMLLQIAEAITDYLNTHELNYIITDILEMILEIDWLPIDDVDCKLQQLFETLIDKVLVDAFMNNANVNKHVHNYNLSLINVMVKKWCNLLTVPTALLETKIISAPRSAVYFILILLGEISMARKLINEYIILNFLLEQLQNWEIPDETWLKCCECSGLYLKFLLENKKENDEKSENKSEWRKLNEKISTILSLSRSSKYILKQAKGIKTLCQVCPDVAEDYINLIISIIATNRDVGKFYCLETFALSIPKLKNTECIVSKLCHMNLSSILANRVSPCEKTALRIVHAVTKKISPVDLLSYIKLIIPYTTDNNTEHRMLVYDTFMSTYKEYSANISDDVNVKTLLSICEQNLLLALLDSSQELQTHVLRFWTEETKLSTIKSKERLLAVLDMHSQCTPMDAYALLVPLLMLQLTSRSIDYNEKMFNPFHCAYENYKIPVFCHRQNLSHVTPMFIDTLASQMSYTLSQNIDHNDRMYKTSHHYDSTHAMLRLRATQDPQFNPTLDDHNVANANLSAIFDNSLFNATEYNCDDTMISSRQSQTMPCNKKYRRFLKNPKDVAKIAFEQQMQKKIQHAEMIKQENIKQKNNVKLYRSYKIGDFPDIAIPHSSLIEPLQQLIKLDPLICKDITVSLVCSLMKDTIEKNDPNFYQLVIKSLKKILSNSQKNSAFNAAILEILLTLGVTDCNPQDIVRISKENNLNVLGALYLEKSLLTKEQTNADDNFFPTSSKRLKRNDENEKENDDQKIDKWAHLASLYKSLNDVDVVLSIFHEQFFDQNIQEAAVAEVNGDWKRAKLLFEKAHNQTTNGSSMSEHCLQGIFEAVNNMCEWSEIDNLVKNRTEENRVWSDAWQDWIVPYMYNAYVHMSLNVKNWTAVQEGLQNIQPWINDPNNLEHMKLLAGEDLVIFQLRSSNEANNLLNDLLDKTGEQWVRLNPLCTELGMRMLEKLQKISDIDASLKVLTHINDRDLGSDKMTALLNFWSTKTPAPRDNLIQWNKLAAYRIHFSMMFDDTYQKMMLDDDMDLKRNEIRSHMRQIGYQLRLNIIDTALKQKHQYITKKHLDYLQGLKCFPDNLQPRLKLLKVKYNSLCADLEKNIYKKMQNYILSWKESHQLLEKQIDDDTKIALSEHIGMLGMLLERLSRKSEFDNEIYEKNEPFYEIFSHANLEIQLDDSNDLENIREALLSYGLYNLAIEYDNLETANHKIGEHHYSVARHYYDQLTSDVEIKNDIFQGFVFAILKAMYHGHHEAMHYFPYVLQHKQLLSNEAEVMFVNECAILPVWLFLRWRDLLFSHLSTSNANMITPIIEKLAKTYPDPVAYTYHLTIEKNPALLHNNRVLKIRALLGNKMHEIEQFLKAIQYVTQPELYLKYYLNKATKELVEGKMTALESLLHKVYPSTSAVTTISENNPQPGNIYKRIANYEYEIRNLNLEDRNETKMAKIQSIKQSLERSLQQYMNESKLKAYSPFLYKYLNGSIEIPGQYSGDREPMPQYHAKIMKVEPIVKIMQSLRKPIRISMIGDNGREYKFLVKFGEDLTIDHSLQQLYATMNRILHNDVVCRQRQLTIDTYEIIPLSRSFGLIQWIENTETLEKLVSFALSKKERDQCENVYKEYVTWIANAKRSSTSIVDQYKEAMVLYNKSDVTEMMKKLIGQTRQSALRDTFTDISPSPESFVTLRRNFVASYATMCAAHWISGIGDRHLQNILVVVNSGRCFGIDFGHAFDAGVRASIPELTPFRLTSQILGLLQPFTQGLLGTIMTHVMRALRENKEPIVTCMNMFVHEPIARSSSIDNEIIRNDGEDTGTDSTWLPKRNIEIAMKKLNGIHPSVIMLEQLRETHKDEYFMRYNTIVTGIERPIGKRAAICNKDCLTAAEQVECLLDQATDLNVLGRMYANWKPWL